MILLFIFYLFIYIFSIALSLHSIIKYYKVTHLPFLPCLLIKKLQNSAAKTINDFSFRNSQSQLEVCVAFTVREIFLMMKNAQNVLFGLYSTMFGNY
jgi:hypothetical protein